MAINTEFPLTQRFIANGIRPQPQALFKSPADGLSRSATRAVAPASRSQPALRLCSHAHAPPAAMRQQ